MYNLAWRPPGSVQNTSGHITPEAANITNNFMKTYIGSDQSNLGTDHVAMKGDILSEPPWLAVSDNYTEFVRSSLIQVHRGRVTAASTNHSNGIVVEDEGQEHRLEDVAAIIFATGFEASPSIDFLPKELLQILQFDPCCGEFPLALNVHSTINHSLPTLGFVGFYRSPYWGVMEMQARFLGKLWSGDVQAAKALKEDTTLEKMLELRTTDRLAQFPMGDYAYLMESFSEALGIHRVEPGEGRTGIVLPARYLPDTAGEISRHEAKTALSIIEKTFSDSAEKGKFIARAIFCAMQGDWKLERSLKSSIATYPSGNFSGTAKFLPRDPTDEEANMEYLYLEEGDFVMEQGMEFRANRRYVHRYTESTDTLGVWFVKPDNKTVDYLFHELKILLPEKGSGWRASAHHLCVKDTYDVEYEFRFKGVGLDEWRLKYSVKGPSKDYRIESVYRR
jgi:hypothetical protein